MRKFWITVCVLAQMQALQAGEKMTAGGTAPDFKHEVILKGDEDVHDYEVVIREVSSGNKVLLSEPAGGYAAFEVAAAPDNFRCLWSPDSKFVALFVHDTKHSGDTSLCHVGASNAQKIEFPDLMPKIQLHLTAEMRAVSIRPEVWLPGHRLILSVEGTQKDEAHGSFRFIVTVQLRADSSGQFKMKVVSFVQDRSIPYSVD